MGLIGWLIGFESKKNLSAEELQHRREKSNELMRNAEKRDFIKLYKKLEQKMSFEEITINLILNGCKKSVYEYDASWLVWYLKEIQDHEKLKQYEEIEYQIILKSIPKYYEQLKEYKETQEDKKKWKRYSKEEWIDLFKCWSFPNIEELIKNKNNILKYVTGNQKAWILDKYLKYSWEELQQGNPLIKERENQKIIIAQEKTELELKKALAEKEKEILELQLKLNEQEKKLKVR